MRGCLVVARRKKQNRNCGECGRSRGERGGWWEVRRDTHSGPGSRMTLRRQLSHFILSEVGSMGVGFFLSFFFFTIEFSSHKSMKDRDEQSENVTQHNKKLIKESQKTLETGASAGQFFSDWNRNESYIRYEFNFLYHI